MSHSRMPRVAVRLPFVIAFAASTSCSGGADPVQTVVTLSVSPATAFVEVGGSQTYVLATSPKDIGVLFNWSSSNAGVASVQVNGANQLNSTVTCRAPGSATIYAVMDGGPHYTASPNEVSADITCYVDVFAIKLDTLAAKLGSAPTQLQAQPTDASGRPVVGASVTWAVANPSVASVSTSGLATPLSPGLTPVTATSTAKTSVSAQTLLYVTGNGTCSAVPKGQVAKTSLKFTVQADPGNHAAQIGFPTTPLQVVVFDFSGAFNSQINVSGSTPLVLVTGGWVSPNDCAFVANGMGAIAGQQNVGVRLEGTWTNGALTLKYTVGTNGELSGGPTVYTVTG